MSATPTWSGMRGLVERLRDEGAITPQKAHELNPAVPARVSVPSDELLSLVAEWRKTGRADFGPRRV